MTERELLIDCLGRLNRAGLPYMLTGSMASNYWGIPRTTHDLDLIQLQLADVPAIVGAFEPGYVVQESMVRSALLRPPRQFNVIDPRSALKIDFWPLTDEPFEQVMFARRLEREVLGTTAWIATPEDVILHKLYWDRLTTSERQLGDAAGIVAIREQSLDVGYLREHAKQIGRERDAGEVAGQGDSSQDHVVSRPRRCAAAFVGRSEAIWNQLPRPPLHVRIVCISEATMRAHDVPDHDDAPWYAASFGADSSRQFVGRRAGSALGTSNLFEADLRLAIHALRAA
jgi:hypothetical protein